MECGWKDDKHDIASGRRALGAWVMNLDEWIKSRGKRLGGNNKATPESAWIRRKITRGVEAEDARK